MRITAKAKEKTRDKILRSAHKLFTTKGFDETTTRDIAQRSGLAVGTLFNYFPSKEALGMSLVAEALSPTRADLAARLRGHESPEESLFAFVSACLRRLTPYRKALGAIIESGLSPFTTVNSAEGQRVRAEHLETVSDLIAKNGHLPSAVAMHLYWTLYLGVLAHWSNDDSPNQEDTLALLDQSLRLFVSSLQNNTEEVGNGS